MDHLQNLADTLAHELIHAYDYCRGHVDFKDPHHLACSEIRASSLSGDCFFWKEFLNRLNMGFKGQHKRCVKRRALTSVQTLTGLSREQCVDIIEVGKAPDPHCLRKGRH